MHDAGLYGSISSQIAINRQLRRIFLPWPLSAARGASVRDGSSTPISETGSTMVWVRRLRFLVQSLQSLLPPEFGVVTTIGTCGRGFPTYGGDTRASSPVLIV